MNLGGGGGAGSKGLQFWRQEGYLGGGGSDGGGGGGHDGDGGGRQGGGGGGGDCSPHVCPQGHDPHLISVSVGWANTGDENVIHKKNSTIVGFWGLQLCVGEAIPLSVVGTNWLGFYSFFSQGVEIRERKRGNIWRRM